MITRIIIKYYYLLVKKLSYYSYQYNILIHYCNQEVEMNQLYQMMQLAQHLEFANVESLHAKPLFYQWVIEQQAGYQ